MLEGYFPDFMAFFFPEAAAEIDWSRGFEPLDKELAQVVQDAELGRGYADKPLKVYPVDGQEEWLLVHIWILRLPEPLELRYTDGIFEIEENLNMPYVSFVERRGEARGEARGQIHCAVLLLRDQLEPRSGPRSPQVTERLQAADLDPLRTWGERVITAGSLEEVFTDRPRF
jgi:hypothetical protein